MADKLYHRANQRSSFRPIVRFAVKIRHFVCDHATAPIIKNYGLKVLRMVFPSNINQLNGHGQSLLK